MSSALVAAIIVGNMLLALVLAGCIVQRSERSLCRYALWQVHDTLVDQIAAGGLERDPELLRYLERFERMCDRSDLFTPFRYRAMVRVMRRGDRTPVLEAVYIGRTPESRAIMDEARCAVANAHARLFLLGSPSGWLLLAASPLLVVWLLVSQSTHSPREGVVRWINERYPSPLIGSGSRHHIYA
jgi:hypothetical protein